MLSVLANIQFTYVEKYPDEIPLMEISSSENISDSDVDDLMTVLNEQVRFVVYLLVTFICAHPLLYLDSQKIQVKRKSSTLAVPQTTLQNRKFSVTFHFVSLEGVSLCVIT